MIDRESFTQIGHPETSSEVVEVLVEPDESGVWRVWQARWDASHGHWIRDWTGRPIMDVILGWRPKTQCGCARCVR